MIRQSIKNIIFEALNYDIFRFEDFEIKESSTYSGERLLISKDEYFYQISLEESACKIYYCPGKVMEKENDTIAIGSFENKINSDIHSWLGRVKRDMLDPLQERFITQSLQEFQTKLNEKLEEMTSDMLFTSEEKIELKERLDMIEKMIIENNSENADLQSEIKKMQREIEFLKSAVDTLTKKKWLKNALTKMWTWGQQPENKKMIEAGAEAVKAISQIDFSKLHQ